MDFEIKKTDSRSMKDNIEDVFKVRAKELRLGKDLLLTRAAEIVGVSKATYSGYESGTKFPSIGTLERLAGVLGTSVDYLVGRTDNPVPLNIKLEDGEELHWDGEELTEEQMELITQMLKTMINQNNWIKTNKNAR